MIDVAPTLWLGVINGVINRSLKKLNIRMKIIKVPMPSPNIKECP